MKNYYGPGELNIPESKKNTGKICYITDLTGSNCDLDFHVHKGFTIGNGKQLYWEMIWHGSGHVTVYPLSGEGGRWISGDTIITVHFK